jgi:Delta7-sterol 5-desaturase
MLKDQIRNQPINPQQTMNEYLRQITEIILSTWILFVPGINYYTAGAIIVVLCYIILRKQLKNRRNYKPRPLKTYSKQLTRELFYSVTAQIVMAITGVTLFFVFKDVGFFKGIEDKTSGINSILFAVLSFVGLIVAHDTYFYWTHRFMHHPKVFKHVHLVHHRSIEIEPLSSVSFHPFEAIINASWYVLPTILFPFSPLGSVAFGIFEVAHTVYAHAGYELYPSGFTKNPLFKHFITSTHHNMHHERNGGHYGLYFMWWDWIMKTEFDDYHTRYESLTNRQLIPIQMEMKK